MDNHAPVPSESQQYQQYYQQQYQQQQSHQQPEATKPSTYDPATQSYYASYQPYNPNPHPPQEPQPDYSSYYYPEYTNSYQSQSQTDPSLIHPPGVTVPTEMPQQTLVQNHHHDVYYRHGYVNQQQPQLQQSQPQQPQIGYMAPGYTTFATRGGRGGKPNRGGRHASSRGRGRGRGRGGSRGSVSVNHIPLGTPRQVPQALGQAALVPSRMAWCELCKVDCNTPDVLEQHKNGKKHMKNVKTREELQNFSKVQVGLHNPPVQGPDSNHAASQPEKKEGESAEKEPVTISNAVPGNNNVGVDSAQTSEERVQIGAARGGLKRKMRGGHGGKFLRGSDGLRKSAEPPKPKKTVDLLCELCNVKCESHVVFHSHMAGKKHLSNIKKLQGHQAIPSTLQTLYPPIPNAVSTPSITQENQQHLADSSVLGTTLLNQQGAVQDPQAALLHLLNQHGIQDAQSLLSQMIPVLLNQVIPNGVTAITSGLVTQDQQISVANISTGQNESKCEMVVVDESVQKTESSEGVVAEKSNMESLELQTEIIEPPTIFTNKSTEQQASMDGRGDELVAGGDNSCEQAPESVSNGLE